MIITTLMENTAIEDGFLFEHGLSLHIQTREHRVLFDTGQSNGFIANAGRLGIDLAAVDMAVLSHGHYDHGGGLMGFLALNSKAPVYVSRYAFDGFYAGEERYIGLEPALKANPRLVPVGDSLEIGDGLTLFSCNERPRPYVMDSYGLNVLRGDALMPDDFRHEQYLLIQEEGMRVLISGCSHKGILNIMSWLKPDVLIGGFHFMKVDPAGSEREVLDEAARVLLEYNAAYYTCHCTGLPQYEYLKQLMGNQLGDLAAGQQIVL